MNHFQIYRYGQGIKLINHLHKNDNDGINTGHEIANLFDLPLCIHFSDQDNRIQLLNLTTAETCGFVSIKDAIGRSLQDVSEKNCALRVYHNCNEVMSSKRFKIYEEYVTRNDEVINHCISVKLPWYDEYNNVIGVFGCTVAIGKQSLIDLLMKLSELGILNPLISTPRENLAYSLLDDFKLSKRQSECLKYLIEGNTSKEIAQKVHLSTRTVEHYLDTVRKKLGCRSRLDLIRKATEIMR